jgi:hypothetical protein
MTNKFQPTALRSVAKQMGASIPEPRGVNEEYSRIYGAYECELSEPEDSLRDLLQQYIDKR